MALAESKKFVFKKKRGERLDHFLVVNLPESTRSQITKLIQRERVIVNEQPRKPGYLLKSGDEIQVFFAMPKPEAAPQKIDLQIVAQTPDYIVIDKPAGILTHPTHTSGLGSVAEGIVAKFPEVVGVGEDASRPGIVHRLDQNTSGLLVIARTAVAYKNLKSQFQKRTIAKEYLALVIGRLKKSEGEIALPIARSRKNPTSFVALASDRQGKGKVRQAVTMYTTEEVFDDYTLLRVKPITGRTHQIRVHLKAIGHPIIGDPVYCTKSSTSVRLPFQIHRQFLHASNLSFIDPTTKREVRFMSPLPPDLATLLKSLRNKDAA